MVFRTILALAMSATVCVVQAADKPIDIGSRLELFVDDWLIDRLEGAQRRLHHPVPAEVAVVCDRPWEGNVKFPRNSKRLELVTLETTRRGVHL